MATTKKTQNAKQKAEALGEEIASLMNGIRLVIRDDLAKAADNDWGTVGSLEHVRDRMHETLEFCAGVDPNEG